MIKKSLLLLGCWLSVASQLLEDPVYYLDTWVCLQSIRSDDWMVVQVTTTSQPQHSHGGNTGVAAPGEAGESWGADDCCSHAKLCSSQWRIQLDASSASSKLYIKKQNWWAFFFWVCVFSSAHIKAFFYSWEFMKKNNSRSVFVGFSIFFFWIKLTRNNIVFFAIFVKLIRNYIWNINCWKKYIICHLLAKILVMLLSHWDRVH